MAFYITPSYSISQYFLKIRNLNSDLTGLFYITYAKSASLSQTSAWEIVNTSITFPEKDGYELIFATLRSTGHNEMFMYSTWYDLTNRVISFQLKSINSTIHTGFDASAWGIVC